MGFDTDWSILLDTPANRLAILEFFENDYYNFVNSPGCRSP